MNAPWSDEAGELQSGATANMVALGLETNLHAAWRVLNSFQTLGRDRRGHRTDMLGTPGARATYETTLAVSFAVPIADILTMSNHARSMRLVSRNRAHNPKDGWFDTHHVSSNPPRSS